MCVDFFDDVLDNFIVASLSYNEDTATLLTTLTLRRWLPLPPVRASPTFSLSLWILASISYCESSMVG